MKIIHLALVMGVVLSNPTIREADNAILNAVWSGQKSAVLQFRNGDVSKVESLADDLRRHGYRLDEESLLLNPSMIQVLGGDVGMED